MTKPKRQRRVQEGLARLTSRRDSSKFNRRRCVCGEAFDDHVYTELRFPCARPRCGCTNFEEAP